MTSSITISSCFGLSAVRRSLTWSNRGQPSVGDGAGGGARKSRASSISTMLRSLTEPIAASSPSSGHCSVSPSLCSSSLQCASSQ